MMGIAQSLLCQVTDMYLSHKGISRPAQLSAILRIPALIVLDTLFVYTAGLEMVRKLTLC